MSNELVKITEQNGKQAVSARDLYLGLGYRPADYARWAKSNIVENAFFEENVDWAVLRTDAENQLGGRPTQDYALSIAAAKKLSMMAKTEIGNQIRDYFIECERQMQANKITLPDFTDPAEAAIAWAEQYKEKQVLKLENQKQLEVIESQRPKVEYFDNLVERKLNLNIRDTAKELEISQNDFIEWLTENGYLYRDKKKQLRPYAKHTPSLFVIKEYVNNRFQGVQTLITPIGRETLRLLIG